MYSLLFSFESSVVLALHSLQSFLCIVIYTIIMQHKKNKLAIPDRIHIGKFDKSQSEAFKLYEE